MYFRCTSVTPVVLYGKIDRANAGVYKALSNKYETYRCLVSCFECNLTFLAAQVGGAPGVLALESVSVVHGSVVVGARVV